LDVLRWLEGESRELDPDGEGVTFVVRVEDQRPPGSPDTMARWRAVASSKFEYPEIKNARPGDYLLCLSTACGRTFKVTKAAVVVRPSRKGKVTRAPERPPAPNASRSAPTR